MKKILFATDLDKTILFNKDESMERNVLALFREMKAQQIKLVLVTARDYEQIKGIQFISEVGFHAIICSLGYKIYIDGKEESKWSAKCEMETEKLQVQKAIYIIQNIIGKNLERMKVISKGYIHIDIKNLLSFEEKNILQIQLLEYGYLVYTYGSRVKIFSKNINKGTALKYYISKYLGEQKCTLIGAGNDLIDIPLLEICHQAIIPQACEIEGYNSYYKVTKVSGIMAAEEILSYVLELNN